MAKKRTRSAGVRAKASSRASKWNFPFTKHNFIIFAASLGIILIAYGLMSTGITSDPEEHLTTWDNPMAIVVAPLLLTIAYCILIPYGIMKSGKSDNSSE